MGISKRQQDSLTASSLIALRKARAGADKPSSMQLPTIQSAKEKDCQVTVEGIPNSGC
jgi:hypothetical protein